MAAWQAAWIFEGVHIRCCGHGHLWFRSYSGSLGKAPSNQGLLPLTFGASPRLGMPSLRSCSVGPPPSAIHGRRRLTRHPCRVAHYAEPPLGLMRGRVPQKRPRRPTGRPVCWIRLSVMYLFEWQAAIASKPHRINAVPVGAGLPAKGPHDSTSSLTETPLSRASPLPH
ncbi:hypothetical protein D9M70_140940 [compost metagenome]